MTSGTVNDFVSSLVEMAKAKEMVPQLEEDIRALVKETDSKTIHIQELELNIIGYKRAIEELQSNLRTVEAARDDAEYRFLESEERQHAVLASVHSAQADLAVILAKIDPPKPEPVAEPEPLQPQAVPAEVTETASPAFATTEYDPYQPVEVKTSTDADQGQGATDPTEGEGTTSIVSTTNSVTTASPSDTASMTTDPTLDPYSTEPDKYTRAWYHWADEMDDRYGIAAWPAKRSA